MSRLTERDEYGNANIIGVDSQDLQLNLEYDQFDDVTSALNRLADFEDMCFDKSGKQVLQAYRLRELAEAEREGRVVVIPYKWLYERIGDYAYMVDDEVIEVIICSVSLDANGTLFVGVASNDGSEFYTEFESVEVTTRLFETRAKAERALAATEPKGGLDGK